MKGRPGGARCGRKRVRPLSGEVAVRAQLVPVDGSATIEIIKDMTLVGRKEDCDLRLPHKSVSKLHCVVVKTDGLLLLRDLGSTNGTRVNGQRVRRAALLPNDLLSIASFKFRVHLGPDAVPADAEVRTQQLDAHDLAHLLRKSKPPEEPTAPAEELVEINPLPDVYPPEEASEA
jgi:predicted component of type VI protein secretion system